MTRRSRVACALAFFALCGLLFSAVAVTGQARGSSKVAAVRAKSDLPGKRVGQTKQDPQATSTTTVAPSTTVAPTPTAPTPTAPAPQPTEAPAPTPAPTTTVAPPAGVAFVTLGPGSSLPSGAQCAGSVEGSGFEPRPENAAANGYVAVAGSDYSLSVWDGYLGMDPAADRLRQRVDGNFRGTTDEIIRWGACKWGFSEDVVRAVAVTESTWRQSTASDLVDGVPQSFGLLQVKRTAHPGSYPASQRSTAWNVDYALAYRRACYEGWIVWLRELGTGYAAGDEWGCVAHWYSGSWRDSGEAAYVADVQSHLADHTWSQAGF